MRIDVICTKSESFFIVPKAPGLKTITEGRGLKYHQCIASNAKHYD